MKMILAAVSLVLAGALECQASIITQWTFEGSTTPSDVTDAATIGSIAASSGNGTASGFHTSALTDWTTPVGINSENSLSAVRWAIGDYFQFQSGTVGHGSIQISFKATGSSGGPKEFKLAYSTTGVGAFTDFASYVLAVNVSPNEWASSGMTSSQIAVHTYSFDLSGVSSLNNAGSVYFRLINTSTMSLNGGIVAANGTSRVDDFTISGAAVPEPAELGAISGLGLMAVLGLHVWRERRKSISAS